MRKFSTFLFLFFLFNSLAFSQDSSRIQIPSDTSAYCIVQLEDGMILKGRVISNSVSEIKFRENNLGLITLPLKKISFLTKGGSDMYFLFYMKDGALLHGKIISQTETQVEIETNSIGKQTIPLERIKEIRKINRRDIRKKGKYWYPNMNASRYFFSPSAIPLEKGTGYYQSADLLVHNFNMGLAKNFSFNAGAALPFGVFFMPKYGRRVAETLFIGAGAFYGQTLLKYRKTNYKLGAMYVLSTFGNANNHLTFGIGQAFFSSTNEVDFFPKPVMMINGTLRFSRRFALVGENLILPVKSCGYEAVGKVCTYNYKNANIYGIRFMKEKVSADFGLLHYPQETFSAFPYLDFVIKF